MSKFKTILKYSVFVSLIMLAFFMPQQVFANSLPTIDFSLSATDNPESVVSTLQLLFFLSIITLAPSLIIMLTCFTRFIIAFHFLRSALGTQQMPPNQILIALALFLTLFMMEPQLEIINNEALKPYSEGLISQGEAIERGMAPIKEFMINQAENKDLALFAQLSGEKITLLEIDWNDTPENIALVKAENLRNIPTRVLIPAFMLGELTKGFKFGFLIYLPFIVIDMVVASTLMAMGMMMLPPAMISLPFKILLFIMVEGWSKYIETIISSFR